MSSSVLLAFALGLPATAHAGGGKTSLCHTTGSSTNPYNVISVADSAVAAHAAHGDFSPFTIWADADGDGFGDAASALTAQCSTPAGYSDDADDCDDTDADVNPGAIEVPYDGIDNDCAGASSDDDLDGDGFGLADDCDDTLTSINPGAMEVPYDGADNDCDAGTPDDDLDGDGYDEADDCDDTDEDVHPGMSEVAGNGIDDDCDPATVDVVAQSWNAADDYTGSNGGSEWSYGFTRAGVPWQLVTYHGTAGILDWWNWGGSFYLMQVYKNTSSSTVYGNCADWCLQPGALAMHPSSDAAVTSGARFTAPSAGTYDISATFSPIDAQSNSIAVGVRVNGSYVWNGTLTTRGSSASYTGSVTLAAGSTIDFLVNNNGTWVNDGTDLDATITLD